MQLKVWKQQKVLIKEIGRPNFTLFTRDGGKQDVEAFAWQKKILILDDINDTGATFKYILDNFGKRDDRIKFAALINNKPSPIKMDYHGYEINKDEVPSWIVFPWEEWDK